MLAQIKVCILNFHNLETITVKFNNKKIVSDIYGNYLETDVVTKQIPFFLSVVSDAEKAQASQGSTMSLVSLILTFGTSIFISVVLGGTIEATWLLLGTLQMMSLVPLFNLNLPGNFREFSVNLAVLNGEPQAFPNIFENFIDTSNLKPFNPYFELMSKSYYLICRFQDNTAPDERRKESHDMDSHDCFNGSLLHYLWSVQRAWKMVSTNIILCRGGIVRKLDYKIRYGMFIRGVSQSYLSLVVSAVLNIYTVRYWLLLF